MKQDHPRTPVRPVKSTTPAKPAESKSFLDQLEHFSWIYKQYWYDTFFNTIRIAIVLLVFKYTDPATAYTISTMIIFVGSGSTVQAVLKSRENKKTEKPEPK